MAGGLGTRMRSATPKHLHPLLGRRVVDWVLDAARALEAEPIVVVASPSTRDEYGERDLTVAVQEVARGTGDAVESARDVLRGFDGRVLVLDAAAPLLTAETLRPLVDEHERSGAAVTLLSIEPAEQLPSGRVLRDGAGAVQAIVEERDATPEQRAVRELNSSIYVFESGPLWDALESLDSDNAQGELYLTDTIAQLVASGRGAGAYRSPDSVSPVGINDRVELAFAASVLRDRINEGHMRAGATIVDPASAWIDVTVEIEPDTTIHPFTVLRGRSHVREGAQVGPHVVAVDAEIGPRALVGPFCYLRPGTVLAAGAKAGTFVEIKNSNIGEGTKVPHLSYIGDADLGDGTNVGAGTITANFAHRPGLPKGRTKVGRNVRLGIHNGLQAPIEIGDDAWTAGGSYLTEDVPPASLAGFPPRQVTKEGYLRGDRNGD